MPGYAVLTVTDVVRETPTSLSLVFDGPPADHVRYRPGQFLTFRVPSEESRAVARCYSLSSSPATDDHLKVTIKRVPGGFASNWLCDHAAIGMPIEVLSPAGTFTPRDYDTDALMLAGGSGITPIMSIVKTMLAEGRAAITLVYANHDDSNVIFAEELDRLCRRHPDRLRVIHWLDTLQGLPSPELLAGLVSTSMAPEAFLCGPAPFMAAARAGLELTGTKGQRIHTEVFTSLASDPFTPVAGASEGEPEPASTSTGHVQLDGQTYTFDWPQNRTLVEVLLSMGVEVPYACREGECGACACTVTNGRVEMAHSDILDPEDVLGGVILGCQAQPVTTEVSITFE